MQYTVLGKTGYRVSRLGYGAMRLPTQGDRIDRDKAIPMLRRAVARGVNFIDSAAGYNAGDSERVIGEMMRAEPGLRERLVLSTKNGHYNKHNDRPWWDNLEGSLTRLGVESIDLYHFHFLAWESFEKHVAGPDGQLRWARKAFDQGLIKHICFSFHDKPENLIRLARTGEFESVICQYNLIDQANEKAIDFLAKSGMGVVIMGPVGGGRLGAPSKALMNTLPAARSVPEVALRFVLANPSVHVAISGMSEMSHVEENTRVASRRSPLSAAEKRRIRAALVRYRTLAQLYCTGCNYCMPCPHGVQIPVNFTLLNYQRVYDLPQLARQRYSRLEGKATQCVACGACLGKCPQHIDIVKQLRETVRTLDDAYGKVVLRLEPVELVQSGRGHRGAAPRRGRAAELRCRLEAHNLSDQEAAPRVSLAGAPGSATHSEVPLKTAGPFARATSELAVKLASFDGAGRVEFNPTIAPPLKMICSTPCVSFATAPAVTLRPGRVERDTGSPLAVSRSPAVSRALAAVRPIKASCAPGAGKKAAAILKAHSLAARFGYCEEGLLMQFDVAGPFSAAFEKKQATLPGWSAGRVVVSLGLGPRQGLTRLKDAPAGAEMRLFLSPGRFEISGPQLSEEEKKQVHVEWLGNPATRRIVALVPWGLLRLAAPKGAARMGLAFRLACPRNGRRPPFSIAWTDPAPGYLLLTPG